MATHSSVLVLKIPGTGEPGGLPSMGSHGVAQRPTRLKQLSSSSSRRELVMNSEAWHATVHGATKNWT